jgi:hypothetical protein
MLEASYRTRMFVMTPLSLKLKSSELERIRYLLKVEEPRVIRRANILNCLHLGYVSSDIAMILDF